MNAVRIAVDELLPLPGLKVTAGLVVACLDQAQHSSARSGFSLSQAVYSPLH